MEGFVVSQSKAAAVCNNNLLGLNREETVAANLMTVSKEEKAQIRSSSTPSLL